MPSFKDLVECIAETTIGIKKQMEANLPLMNDEIESILKNKDLSEERIEFLLDALLDYLQLGIGEPEFKKLNAYYSTFNQENADAYYRFYREIMED